MPHPELKDLRRQMLETLEDYEGDTAQLSCNIPTVVNDALRAYAEMHGSHKITKSHVVQFALIRWCLQHKLLPEADEEKKDPAPNQLVIPRRTA